MTIGQLIKSARKKAGLTQKELGEKLGISYQSVAQWENDLRNPKYATLQRIAAALGTTVNWLLPPDNYWEDENGVGHSEPMPEVSELALEKRLQDSYSSLTLEGKGKAVERVEELTEIPRYRRQDVPQSPPAPTEGKDITKPPDAPKTLPEGE